MKKTFGALIQPRNRHDATMIPPPWRQQRGTTASPAYIPVAVPSIYQAQIFTEAAPLRYPVYDSPPYGQLKRKQPQVQKTTYEPYVAVSAPPQIIAEEAEELESVAAGHQNSDSLRAKRARRFAQPQTLSPPPLSQYSSTSLDPNVVDWDSSTVVGYSTALEKRYFRLTSAPDPSTVRPLRVLEQTFELLKRKWKQEQNYSYICDQFKSLRQDLTVQRIKNNFVVTVYETHARIALEKGDFGEFNQCATQLESLYALRLGGHPNEFLAYRILYLLHTANKTDMNDVLLSVTAKDTHDPMVSHAMKVRKALMSGNYYSLSKLYDNAPNMSAYLMDRFMKRERITALTIMCKAYRPTVSLPFVVSQLGFETAEECKEFFTSLNANSLLDHNEQLLTQTALPFFERLRRDTFPAAEVNGLL